MAAEKISSQEYHNAYQRTLQQYQRRLRQPFTNEQARAIGLDRERPAADLSEAAIDVEARKLGLNVSDDALRNMIESNPDFPRQVGRLRPSEASPTCFANNDMNERMFVSDLRKTALRQFIVAALTAGIAAPKAEVKAEADFQGQTRSTTISPCRLPRRARLHRFRGDVEVLLQ